MSQRRFLTIAVSILSILLLTSIGFAREGGYVQSKQIELDNSKNVHALQKIGNEKIEIDANAPMKVAVDKYMLKKKAEEKARLKAEEEARKKADQAKRTASSASGSVQTSASAEGSHAKTGPQRSVQSEQARAEQILASLVARNPILQGAKVYVRECPHNWQGCTYYKSAEIWIDPDHRASLEKIIVHECNHIIDWRSDGDIDHNDYHE